jgi:hypothetical protein
LRLERTGKYCSNFAESRHGSNAGAVCFCVSDGEDSCFRGTAAGGFHSLTRDPEIVVRQQGSDHAADIVGQADAPKGNFGRPGRNGPYEPRRLSTFISKKRRP